MTIAPLPNESPGKPDCYFVAYEGGIVFGVMTTAEGGGPSQDWKILCSPPVLLESQEEKKKQTGIFITVFTSGLLPLSLKIP